MKDLDAIAAQDLVKGETCHSVNYTVLAGTKSETILLYK